MSRPGPKPGPPAHIIGLRAPLPLFAAVKRLADSEGKSYSRVAVEILCSALGVNIREGADGEPMGE